MIDLGGNVAQFGGWSDEVDWEHHYNDETEKKFIERDLVDFLCCHECDAMIDEYACEYCGAEAEVKVEKAGTIKIAKQLRALPSPNAEHIVNYCIKKSLECVLTHLSSP